jgi:hypothetical protein
MTCRISKKQRLFIKIAARSDILIKYLFLADGCICKLNTQAFMRLKDKITLLKILA